MNVILLLSITFLGFSSFFFLLGIFLIGGKVVTLIDWRFFLFFGGEFNYSIIVDGYGLVFGRCVLFISGRVFLFSCGYIGAEFNKKRFSLLVVSFIVSIILLIFSGNLVGVLLGWDGLGLTSFLLVIYYQNPYSFGAGMITALTNRLGDIGLILSTGLLLDYGHWRFSFLNSVPLFVVYIVFLGALTKRAQYPFSSWLPMAIAAPTPVSALVHSSTLVTAGVFLLIRFYPILEF